MGSEFCFKKLMFPFKDYGIVESGEAAFEVATFITGVPVESLREGRLRRTRGNRKYHHVLCIWLFGSQKAYSIVIFHGPRHVWWNQQTMVWWKWCSGMVAFRQALGANEFTNAMVFFQGFSSQQLFHHGTPCNWPCYTMYILFPGNV